MAFEMPLLQVCNYQATGTLSEGICSDGSDESLCTLETAINKLYGDGMAVFQYKPKRVEVRLVKFQKEKEHFTTVSVFKSDKLMVKGCETVGEAEEALKKASVMVQTAIAPFSAMKVVDFLVTSAVCTTEVGFRVHLEFLAARCSHYATYQPERSASLSYRMVDPKCTAQIYGNGGVQLTGMTSQTEYDLAMRKLLPILHEHRLEGGEIKVAPTAEAVAEAKEKNMKKRIAEWEKKVEAAPAENAAKRKAAAEAAEAKEEAKAKKPKKGKGKAVAMKKEPSEEDLLSEAGSAAAEAAEAELPDMSDDELTESQQEEMASAMEAMLDSVEEAKKVVVKEEA